MINVKSPAIMPLWTPAQDESLGTAAVIAAWAVLRTSYVRRLAFTLKTAVVSSGSVVITFKRYPTHGSSAGAVTMGTVTVPAAALAGKCYYKDISAVKVSPSEMVVAEVTTATAGGGAAGDGTAWIETEDSPEDVRNNTNMIASA